MALQTKTITGSTNNSNWTWKMEVIENSTDINSNTSSVTINTYLGRASSSSYFGGNATVSINCNGEARSYSKTFSYPTNVGAGGWVLAQSETFSVKHNDNGTKDINVSSSMSTSDFTPSYSSASGSITLTTIPRYATSTHSLKSKTETTISINWSSDSTIDYIWVSKNNGSTWSELDVTDGTSGSYTLKNLSANTTYNIITRVRRKDSQLTTDSSAISVTTYSYPYATSSSNFVIGNDIPITLYNPLGRDVNIKFYGNDNSLICEATRNISGETKIGNTSAEIEAQYKSIPNSKSGTYKVNVTYGSVTKTRNNAGTYSIKGTETPTVGTFTYKDSNSSTTAITGDNQRIIRNNSNLLFTIGSATAKNSASISKYEVTFNGITKSRTSTGDVDFGTVNVANNLSATLKVTDSRGLTAAKSITVVVDNWELPNALISLNRKNNYYSETYLKVDGSCSHINGKNALTIKYQYKKVLDSSYSSLITINDNEEVTLDFDNQYQWNVKVLISDKIGTTTYNLVLDRGMPIAYFDRLNSAVGINAIPNKGEALKVAKGNISFDGTITAGDVKCKNMFNINNLNSINMLTQNGYEFLFDSTFWYGHISHSYDFKINKPYSFSFNITEMSMPTMATVLFFYTDDTISENNIDTPSIGKYSLSLIPTKKVNYVELRFFRLNVNGVQRTGKVTDIQIEEGPATEYTSYKAFGVMSGSNSNGSWTKFDDGTLFMYGSKVISIQQEAFTGLGNTGLVYTGEQEIVLPITSTIDVRANVNVRSANFDWASRVYGYTTAISFNIVSNSNQKRNVTFTWSAIGRWK